MAKGLTKGRNCEIAGFCVFGIRTRGLRGYLRPNLSWFWSYKSGFVVEAQTKGLLTLPGTLPCSLQ